MDEEEKLVIEKDPSCNFMCRYWVRDEDGYPLTATMTLWGAKRFIKKRKLREVVYEELTHKSQEKSK